MKKVKSKPGLRIEDLALEDSKKDRHMLADSKLFITNEVDDTPSSTGEKPKRSHSSKKLTNLTAKKTQNNNNLFDSFQGTNDLKTESNDFQSGSKFAYLTPALNLQGSSRFGSTSKNPFQGTKN